MPGLVHEFILVCDGLDPTADDYEGRLYAAGLDDATVSWQRGLTLVDVTREAATVAQALDLAMGDAARAGARVIRVEPDHLVTVPEMARRAGLTRAAVSYYARGLRGTGFPPPVACVTSDHPFYDWAETAAWLRDRGVLSAAEAERAVAVRDANNRIARRLAARETA